MLALLVVAVGGELQAQQSPALQKGNKAYEEMSYLDAIKYYEKALKKKFDKNGLLRLADSYRLTNNSYKAAGVYSKVVNLNQIPPINYFYFAQALMNLKMYPEATKWFERYAKEVPADPRGAKFAMSCRTIESYFADTGEVKLRPFPYNTKVDEFSPVWFDGGILFSSSRADGAVVDSRYEWNGQPFLDLYYSKLTGEGDKFGRPVLVKGKLNTRFHEATCAWDSINRIAYFTRNNYFEGKKTSDESGTVNLKLFYADVPTSGPWTNVRSVHFNSDDYSVGHPAVLAGSKTLLFISDKPGGFGGTDIYRSDFNENDGWSDPVNLGAQINGPGNEMFPYVTPDGILYFSSDGMGGLGGLDIFMCDLDVKDCKPQNLGAPINSSSDDFGFLISADHSWGMLSSNREGGLGSDDIYIFAYEKPLWNGVVVDAVTKQPVQGAHVTMYLPKIDRKLTGDTDPEGKLNFLLQRNTTYQVMVDADQYHEKRMSVSTYGTKSGDQLQDTIFLERPSMIVVTKVLDLSTGFPIMNAKVRVIGTNLTLTTNADGEVTFYYDPYPSYETKPLECPKQSSESYCFRFKDEAVLDFDTLQLIYEWSFGDGTKAKELEPRHCYNGPGTYHVELNLLDPAGTLMMNQATYDLEVRAPEGVSIDGPDTVTVGDKVSFSGASSTLEGCKIDGYLWELSSGEIGSGLIFQHQFTKAGLYHLKLDVSGQGFVAPKACGGCVTKDVVVMDAGWRPTHPDNLLQAWSGKPVPPPSNIDCQQQEPEDYCFSFTDGGGLSSDSLPFIYVWDLGDGTRKQGLTVKHCYAQAGTYQVRLEILDPLSRRQVSVVSDYDLEVKDLHQVYIESYDTISLDEVAEFDALKSDAPGCEVNAVYWNFGDGSTGAGAQTQHQYPRRGTYRVQMVLEGKEKATGQPCMRCSYKEVQVLPAYQGNKLRDSLEQASTLTQPIAVMPDGTILLEIWKEGYEKRRLSFDSGTDVGTVRDSVYLPKSAEGPSVVVEITDEATKMRVRDAKLVLRDAKTGIDIGTYSVKDGTITLPLEPGKTYSLLASKDGYFTGVKDVGPLPKGKKNLQVDLGLQAAVVGSSWILKNLYYDFDKANIRHDAAIELEKLTGFLKANPSLTVELGSHTDVRGSDEYNLVLAQNRANSAVEYLKSRGIAANRIIARGYGEQKLVNRCEDGVACSEELHQENRRTEITVLGFKDPIYSQARRVEEIWGTESLSIPSSPSFSGPFTILVGTYLNQKGPVFFQALGDRFPVTGKSVDGFWEYVTGNYSNFESAAADLPEVERLGFPYASVLARPNYNLTSTASKAPSKTANPSAAAPSSKEDASFYSVQVAVLGRTVQDNFLKSFGEYQDRLYEKQIGGSRVFFIGQYATEQEAMKHLSKIRRTGHSDAFLVMFDRGKKVNLDKIGGQ